jgi:hypothetical protein
MEISKMLPPRSSWGLPAFDEAKEKVKQRFKLGSNKFSQALDLIQRNREMGSRLGLEFPLAYLSDEQAVAAVQLWSRRHPPRPESDGAIDYFARDWDKVIAQRKVNFEVNEEVLRLLSPEALADLEVIFYIGRERLFSEWYAPRLTATLKRYTLEKTPQEPVANLMGKMNLFTCLVRGMRILGRPSLAERLLKLRPDLELND